MTNERDESGPVELEGSARSAPPHPRVGEVDPSTHATISIYLRGPELDDSVRIDRDDYVATFGASAEDVSAVEAFAGARGLIMGEADLARRRLELTGSIGDLADAFGAELSLYASPDGTEYRGREGSLRIPSELGEVVRGVFGLDERPQATPKFRVSDTPSVSYTPPQVAAAYSYPSSVNGSGECVALIELGGGFRPADITAYFETLSLTAPDVVAVLVDGASNDPTTSSGPDGEVMLDIEVVGSIAPGARIAVYFAPNTDQGFLDAVTKAVHDATNSPSVVSISWGGSESTWTEQAMNAMEQAFTAAAALGVTVTVAAGDNGSTDGVSDGLQHVDFPRIGTSHALGCGGTRLELSDGTIASESVWNDGTSGGASGGGISAVFPLPSYQAGANVPPSANPGARPGRGVPDVAGDADPDSGYSVRVDGQTMTIGGTSAVAPLWAGLIALLNESRGEPVGFLHPMLYASPEKATFLDVVTGSNGAYSAAPGWDPCTGLGTPEGEALLASLEAPTAG